MTASFLRRLWSAFQPSPVDGRADDDATLAQPRRAPTIEVQPHQSRLAVAAATVLGLVVASALAMGSLVTLALALAVIYYLLTEVLGIRLELDPKSLFTRAQQYAASQRN